MKKMISRKHYRFFGLKKYIIVAVHKQTRERQQFISISRKSENAILDAAEVYPQEDYQLTAYTELQYEHMLKLSS